MEPEYFVHSDYSISGGHKTYEEALVEARKKAKERPGTECLISRSISQHTAVAGEMTMYEYPIRKAK